MFNNLDNYLKLIDRILKKNFTEMDLEALTNNTSELTKLIGLYIKLTDLQQKSKVNNEKFNQKEMNDQDHFILDNFINKILKK